MIKIAKASLKEALYGDTAELAEKYGTTRAAVRTHRCRLRKRLGVKLPPFCPPPRDEVKNLRSLGFTQKQIGKHFGVSQQYISLILRKSQQREDGQ